MRYVLTSFSCCNSVRVRGTDVYPTIIYSWKTQKGYNCFLKSKVSTEWYNICKSNKTQHIPIVTVTKRSHRIHSKWNMNTTSMLVQEFHCLTPVFRRLWAGNTCHYSEKRERNNVLGRLEARESRSLPGRLMCPPSTITRLLDRYQQHVLARVDPDPVDSGRHPPPRTITHVVPVMVNASVVHQHNAGPTTARLATAYPQKYNIDGRHVS